MKLGISMLVAMVPVIALVGQANAAAGTSRLTRPFFKEGTHITVTSSVTECLKVVTPMPITAGQNNRARYVVRCQPDYTNPCYATLTISGTGKDGQPFSYQDEMVCRRKGSTSHVGLACEDSACIVDREEDLNCVYDDLDSECPYGPCTECTTPIPTLTEWGLIIFGVVLLGFITWVFLKRRKIIGVWSKV